MFNTLFAQGGLTLDRLRTFCTVAEAAGVTKAAGKNPVRQSQFSRQIKELETFFGTELMIRGKKGIALTPAGKRLAQISRGIFSSLGDFNSDCKAEPQRFAIGAGDSLLLWLLLPNVTILQNALPNVALDVSNFRTLDIVERVNDLRLDFGLIRRDAVSPLQNFKSLGFETYGLFVPVLLLAKQRVRDWKDVIARIPLTTIAGEGTFRAALEKAAQKNGTTLTFCLSCSTFPQAASALRTGDYAAILPTIATVELDRDKFTIISAPFIESQAREVCLVWNPRTLELRPKAAEFKDRLVNLLKLPGKSTARQA